MDTPNNAILGEEIRQLFSASREVKTAWLIIPG